MELAKSLYRNDKAHVHYNTPTCIIMQPAKINPLQRLPESLILVWGCNDHAGMGSTCYPMYSGNPQPIKDSGGKFFDVGIVHLPFRKSISSGSKLGANEGLAQRTNAIPTSKDLPSPSDTRQFWAETGLTIKKPLVSRYLTCRPFKAGGGLVGRFTAGPGNIRLSDMSIYSKEHGTEKNTSGVSWLTAKFPDGETNAGDAPFYRYSVQASGQYDNCWMISERGINPAGLKL